MSPEFLFLAGLVAGFLIGLLGYAQARRRAFRDFVAASQRSRLAGDAVGAPVLAAAVAAIGAKWVRSAVLR